MSGLNFATYMKRLKMELEALKTARIKSAQTINVHEWQSSGTFTIEGWLPQNSLKITIEPTSTTSPNILTSIQGTTNDYNIRVLRDFSEGKTIYYLSWLGHQHWQDDQEDEEINIDVVVRYTAPANISIESVPDIYGY